ncbi:hypothetical protein NL503_27600, partial [Klebsiella pneumoniae]|nr:hypothetical protein [Klebsiella pneumoniae]
AIERASLGVGGLLLPSSEALPPDTRLELTLLVSGGAEVVAAARVVGALPGALALQLEGTPAEIVSALLAPPPQEAEVVQEPEAEEAASGSLW